MEVIRQEHTKGRFLVLWLSGTIVFSLVFYFYISHLWLAATKSKVETIANEITSTLHTELSEGNFFKLSSSLSRLKSSGTIEYAEVRQRFKEDQKIIFKTSNLNESDTLFKKFTCFSEPKIVNIDLDTVQFLSVIPSNLIEVDCVFLLLQAKLPSELKAIKNNMFVFFLIMTFCLLALFFYFFYKWYLKNLKLEVQNKTLSLEKEINLAELAAQVAHDIRSPYSVLKSYTKNLSGIPADVKKAIELSVSRIGDILSDLEVGAKKTIQRDLSSEAQAQISSNESTSSAPTQESATAGFTKTIVLIALDRIISEKRYQCRDSDQMQITDQMSLDSTATILVNSKNLGRVISNLLDNAIQAKDPSRPNQITVAAFDLPDTNQIEIRISDTGKGIGPEVLPKLFQKGATFDKDNGTGLGLFHAKTQVESWGGAIQIQSTQNAGTEVAITLPLVDPPAWLQSKIRFPNDSTVLILDDDLSIHEFWKNQLVDCQLLLAQSFNTAKDMMRELPDYFIVDFDLHDSEKSGLDFIKEFGLGEQSILVTSHFEDPAIHEECQNLGIKIFPKPLMAYL